MGNSELIYIQRDTELLKDFSNEELLDEVLDRAGGDSWDGYFTTKGSNLYENGLKILRERLGDWLSE